MRQGSLWRSEEELARRELWERLPQAVRRELVAELVRIVVDSAVKSKERRGRGGEHGLQSAAKPPRA